MIGRQELARALAGVGLLYKFNGRAWDFFEKTPQGFWNAFIVAVILAPFELGHELLIFDPGKRTLDFTPYVVVQVLSYIVTWTLFPFVMMYLVQLLGRGRRYFWYLVPYIWMQLPLGLALFGFQILNDLGVMPDAVIDVVSPLALVVFAVYGTYVAGIGLQVTTGTAVGLVVLDYVLGLLATQIIAQI